jgi:ubiquinone/menaquinone biosynthesis C-methylase UbiE
MARRAPASRRTPSGALRRGRYGNPADLARFLRRQLAPARAAWQKPAAVIRALGLAQGQTVADVGAGPGYFTLRLARAVGPAGRVFAVDPEPVMLEVLRRRLERAGLRQVTPVLGRVDDPSLPRAACDVVFLANAYHHLRDGPRFLQRLVRALKPGGRLINIDWERRETPVGPPVRHRVARETFLAAARRAGLVLAREHALLPYQYFLELRPRERALRA